MTLFGEIPRGSDLKIPFQYRDSDKNGIDLNNLDTILVVLYHQSGKNLVKYTDPSNVGYEDVEIDNATEGKFHVKLQEENTVDAPLGIYHVEVKVKRPDPDWKDSDWKHLLKREDLLEIVKGQTTYENP